MRGRRVEVEWRESEAELYERFRRERDVERRRRLHAFWLLRSGRQEKQAAFEAGVALRTLVRWLGWYRSGGLEGVLRRVPGCGGKGKACRLSEAQQRELYERASAGEFKSTPAVREWVKREWGVSYSEVGMGKVLRRLTIRPKVPRPQHVHADPQAQEAWKKGGS